jgi:hypothetical protein
MSEQARGTSAGEPLKLLSDLAATKGAQGDLGQQCRTRHRGVSYEKRNCLWRARLYCKGNHTTLGRFKTAELAARAYDRAAVFVYGGHAVTNFGINAAQIDVNLHPFVRYLAHKLSSLREAVVRDQEASVKPSERHASAIRRAAAAAAFAESCHYALLGPTIAHSCGARERKDVFAPAFKTLVLAALYSPRYGQPRRGSGRG